MVLYKSQNTVIHSNNSFSLPKITNSSSSSSANEVSFDEGILTQIFLCLPAKSLCRCKCVSKQWHSIINSPHFTRLRIPCFNPARGLFLCCSSLLGNPYHEFISFSLENLIPAPFQKLCPFGLDILHSCNGLLLCCNSRAAVPGRKYYICNPTTQQSITLPEPVGEKSEISKVVLEMKLAFEPWKSPHYKVVCIRMYELALELQFQIYSSVTKKWSVSNQPFHDHHHMAFALGGVYWNGAIYWLCGDSSLRFIVEEEKLERFPIPCIGRSWEDEGGIAYYGESCGHLHLVQLDSRQTFIYNIYEMRSDGTEWILKYQVNIEDVVAAFPPMNHRYRQPMTRDYLVVAVLCIVRGEKEGDAIMVLEILGRIIHYNLRDNTCHKLCEFAKNTDNINQLDVEDEYEVSCLDYDRSRAFQYIESECCL